MEVVNGSFVKGLHAAPKLKDGQSQWRNVNRPLYVYTGLISAQFPRRLSSQRNNLRTLDSHRRPFSLPPLPISSSPTVYPAQVKQVFPLDIHIGSIDDACKRDSHERNQRWPFELVCPEEHHSRCVREELKAVLPSCLDRRKCATDVCLDFLEKGSALP